VKPALSLKARALALLARREHSRAELRRKLMPHARAAALAQAAAAAQASATAAQAPAGDEVAARDRSAAAPARSTPAAAGLGAGSAAAAPSSRLAGASATLAQLQAAYDLHRSPGPAPARPGIFSSAARQNAGPRRSGWQTRAGQAAPHAAGAQAADVDLDAADDFDAPPPQGAAAEPAVDTAAAWAEAQSAVEELLDWLQANRYLSEERFVESRVHARAGRFGNLRIRQELAQHGVALDTEAAQQLRDTELERCRAVWVRKFGGEPPADAAARARQMRFLAGRGFSADVIRRVLQAGED
jgi:SOS response regulatory protein OraA/RecX